MHLQVTSEYGRLREAIVHRPGRELLRMTPSTRDYFMFDDLLYDEHARREHDWFTSVVQDHLGIKLHFFQDLLEAQIYPLAIYLDDAHNYFCRPFFYDTPDRSGELTSIPPEVDPAVRLIRVTDFRPGATLRLVMSDERSEAVAYLEE
jgi:hypothetical protein